MIVPRALDGSVKVLLWCHAWIIPKKVQKGSLSLSIYYIVVVYTHNFPEVFLLFQRFKRWCFFRMIGRQRHGPVPSLLTGLLCFFHRLLPLGGLWFLEHIFGWLDKIMIFPFTFSRWFLSEVVFFHHFFGTQVLLKEVPEAVGGTMADQGGWCLTVYMLQGVGDHEWSVRTFTWSKCCVCYGWFIKNFLVWRWS